MIATKLFHSSSKPVHLKPVREKIKHKTYRQLLNLDRPKKKIEVESDEDHDDILEKLLREEKTKKKKKYSRIHIRKNKSKQSQQKHKVDAIPIDKIQNAVIKEKLSPTAHRTNERKQRQRIPTSGKAQNQIVVDQSDTISYIVNNALANSSKIKSEKALNILKQQLKANQLQIKPSLVQNNLIQHQILALNSNPQQVRSKENKFQTWLRFFQQSSKPYQTERRIVNRDRLFPSQQRQAKFYESLGDFDTKRKK